MKISRKIAKLSNIGEFCFDLDEAVIRFTDSQGINIIMDYNLLHYVSWEDYCRRAIDWLYNRYYKH